MLKHAEAENPLISFNNSDHQLSAYCVPDSMPGLACGFFQILHQLFNVRILVTVF